ncbi:hypothetical protein [Streptomyces shenzhenensis]|uniref:hypothetical protein n=1 Tax=Streptomyces shenzhenensis TaxID=943815 RepID=UPI0015F07AAA|nr:hypothetical protein [Streptomyces shenzhenensis]
MDADFLLALGAADLAPAGRTATGVRPLSNWVPLAQLPGGCEPWCITAGRAP